jgi:competence protein ComEC
VPAAATGGRAQPAGTRDPDVGDEAAGERLDGRLVGPALAAWASAAVFLQQPVWGGLTAGLLLVVGAVATRVRHRTAAVALTAAAAAALVAALRVAQVGAGPVPDLAAEQAVVEASVVVTGDVRTVTGGFADTDVVRASAREVTGRGVRTQVRSPVLLMAPAGDLAGVALGTRVRLVGRLLPSDGADLAALVRVERLLATEQSPAWWWTAADGVRSGLRASVAWAGDAGALVPALVTGDDRGLSPQVTDDFRTSGLTHLLAVSGTNLTLVLAALLGTARAVGVRGRGLRAVGVLGTVAFVVLARPDPSVLRAAAMGLVALAGMSAGGRRRGLRALCLAVLVLVLVDPWLARSAGFALSALATAAIVVLGPPWRDALRRWLPRWAAEAVAVPLAAQVVCTPVVAVLSGRVSVVAVAANVLVAPAVGPATVAGLAAGVVSVPAAAAARVVGALAVAPAWWIVGVARRAAALPGADLEWQVSPLSLVALTAICAVVVAGTPWVLRSRTASAAGVVLMALAVLQPLPTPGWPPAGWVLVACDVGQGDGLVLAAGARSAVVVDAGPDPDVMRRCLDRLDVRSVAAVVLTHLHADHIGGLAGVLGDWPVAEVDVGPGRSPPQAWDDVRRLAGEAGVPVRTVGAGDRAAVGALSWQVLSPPATAPSGGDGSDSSAVNNASLVLLVESAGIRLLLSGDIEPEVQGRLLGSGVDLDVDVLKVPHHGSAAQDPRFLAATDPDLAVVTVGSDNDYGHPAGSVLAELAGGGAELARTDTEGDVAVVVRDGQLAVAAR